MGIRQEGLTRTEIDGLGSRAVRGRTYIEIDNELAYVEMALDNVDIHMFHCLTVPGGTTVLGSRPVH